MSNRKKSRSKSKATPFSGLPPLNLNAAGIDVGNAEHWVAVPADRDQKPVRKFESFTADLHRMADWLQACGIDSVVMESTGVYWIPLYQVLEARGMEVKLVNARHVKCLPGRKSDIQDCQWLQKLHTFGLLNNSFRPTDEICILRSYLRQRESMISAASTCIQHMQKALTEMNVQLANVISDISGLTGLSIIRSILQGERNPQKLAELRDPRIKASKQEIAKSLEGNWRDELLFVLRQSLELYEVYQNKIADCDRKIEAHLRTFDGKVDPICHPLAPPKRGKKAHSNAPAFDLRTELYRVSGTDLTRIDGIDVSNAQAIISEIGLDMSRWPTEGNFASWLGLSPDHRITGGKIIKRGTRHVVNRAADALRLAAQSLLKSRTALGANFRRLRAHLGPPKAITAMAHKLARLVYRMLKYGQQYVDKGMQHYEERFRQQRMRWLEKQAKELNLQLVPVHLTS
jgi:transposase